MNRPAVYLAGPSVFRPDARQFANRLKALCASHGLEGLYPLDNELAEPTAQAIFEANVMLIRRASAVVAEISPFRGPNADDGTAWEIGFAHALGLPVFAWTDEPEDLKHRVPHRSVGGRLVGADGFEVEDFGHPVNLMLACSCRRVFPEAEKAIAAAAVRLSG